MEDCAIDLHPNHGDPTALPDAFQHAWRNGAYNTMTALSIIKPFLAGSWGAVQNLRAPHC
jgi:hypothetical protein